MKHRPYVIAAGVFFGLFVLFFAGLLFGGGLPAFRDAAHFYPPLFDFCRDEWGAGRVPLWNPYGNFGQPLLADATSSVFYPGKLLYAVLPGDWAWRIYLLIHLPLAAWGTWLLARRYGASVEAAALAALAFTFSGAVLGDLCNVVFLVGAAWLPWAMLAAERMLGEAKIRWAVALGVVLALMVLGGDPQMAYTAGLLAAVRCLASPWALRAPRQACSKLFSRLGLLALAAICAATLSAVQILPSLEFARHSTRAGVTLAERFSAKASPDGHLEEVYQFSVGPWRLTELAWPNVSGRQYPTHQRWLSCLPAEGRIWTPTLYMGVFTLLFALAAMRLCRGARPPSTASEPANAPAVFLTWTAVVAVLASFGWYGLGWLMSELARPLGLQPLQAVGEPFGGVYWLMTLLLPGYAQFRYPAKLLVVAALMLALLAAAGFDRQFNTPTGRFRRVVGWFSLASAALCLAAFAIHPFWHAWFAAAKPDTLFGPLDMEGAWRDLAAGFAQGGLVAAAGYWLLGQRRELGHFSRVVPSVMLLLVAVDLLLANRWLIADAPAELWRSPSRFAEAIQAAEGKDHAPRVFRYGNPLQSDWVETSSDRRLAEAIGFHRDTLWPKFNLPQRIALGEVYGAMMSADWEKFLSDTKKLPLARWQILPADASPPAAGALLAAETAGARLWSNPAALPRAWIARETDLSVASESDTCSIIQESPQYVRLRAEMKDAGMLILADPFFPGWRASVATDGAPSKETPIEKVLVALRGVRLPAGRHEVVFRYDPVSFRWGLGISLSGFLALVVGWIGLYLARGSRAGRPAAGA